MSHLSDAVSDLYAADMNNSDISLKHYRCFAFISKNKI